ncbi:MAG: cell wall-active antibiotics response protein [Prevotellaceae bacterium]|nr:cell wall-active antibiotics response protein [Prevotellaceae bacterium]
MNTKSRTGAVTGVILILLGGLLIASNTGLIPPGFHRIIVSWQMLLIVIGTVSIVKHGTFHFHGLSMLCLGIFFIIPRIATVFPSMFGGMDANNFVSVYWPVLLIVGGIILILYIPVSRRRNDHRQYAHCRRQFRSHWNHDHYRNAKNQENQARDENFSQACIFSNGRYVIDDEFKGGVLQAIFGGIELDLRKAHLPEGETVLNVEAIFGGIELIVPDSWFLDIKVESVLGGIDDRRRAGSVDSTHKLIVKGSAVFGGIEIKN